MSKPHDPPQLPNYPTTQLPNLIHWLAIVALFTALTAAMTYPQLWRMTDAVSDVGDPLLNAWALSWIAHQLPRDPAHLFDGNIFFPEPATLAYSETLLAPGLAVAPLRWLGAGPILVYNLVMISGFILSGVGMALLVRHLTRHTGASIVAGVIFAFLPFRFDHYSQLQLQQAQWIPLALWAFHRLMDDGRLRHGLLLGLFVACQVLSCMYYGMFLACYLVVVGGLLLIANLRVARTWIVGLAAGIALAAALLAPAGTAYLSARQVVGERSAAEADTFSARGRNFLAAPGTNKLYGWTADRFGRTNRRLFPGVLTVLLAAVVLWPPWSVTRAAYLLGLLLAIDLTLGFHGYAFPFLRDHVMPFRALRAPALAVVLVGFSLAVLAGFGVARISKRLRSTHGSAALALVLCAVVLAESRSSPFGLATIPREPPAVYADLLRDLGDASPVPIVEIPLYREDPTYMYYSLFHWQNLLNGYSGFFPPAYVELIWAMKDFPDDQSLAALRERGTRYALVHGELLEPADYQRIIAAVDRCRCGLALISRRPWQGREISLYKLIG